MHIQLTVLSGEIPHPDKLVSDLRQGVLTKRHEFHDKHGNQDVLVFFEGEMKTPFWYMPGIGVDFAIGKRKMTFEQARALCEGENADSEHMVIENVDGLMFRHYYMGAYRRYTAPAE